MKEAQDLKMYFYVDESGDPTILAHKGKNLLAEGTVSKTFMVGYVETRDLLYRKIDIYFAAMGNTVRERNMRISLDRAMSLFREKWGKEHDSEIRVFVHTPSQIPMLQVADYTLWTINRAYERGDFRYYRYLSDKIALIQDIFDTANYPNTYYNPKRLLDQNKISPSGG